MDSAVREGYLLREGVAHLRRVALDAAPVLAGAPASTRRLASRPRVSLRCSPPRLGRSPGRPCDRGSDRPSLQREKLDPRPNRVRRRRHHTNPETHSAIAQREAQRCVCICSGHSRVRSECMIHEARVRERADDRARRRLSAPPPSPSGARWSCTRVSAGTSGTWRAWKPPSKRRSIACCASHGRGCSSSPSASASRLRSTLKGSYGSGTRRRGYTSRGTAPTRRSPRCARARSRRRAKERRRRGAPGSAP